ncbi:hypothetical protein CGZ80_11075 [Rhodopirellula sp. MGV]|nr:hypothetical protein CGZ80_11075 [Rhodopirellula sp. MGV]PNY35010.1 hypothetical protein C2E31_20555 [Rhodopirellula baltica]
MGKDSSLRPLRWGIFKKNLALGFAFPSLPDRCQKFISDLLQTRDILLLPVCGVPSQINETGHGGLSGKALRAQFLVKPILFH